MKRGHFLGAVALTAGLSGAGGYTFVAWAKGVPGTKPLVYRGQLLGLDGAPLSGSHTVKVALYTQESGGNAACAAPDMTVDLSLSRGHFTVPLPGGEGGADCVQIVQQTPDVWIGVSVDAQAFPRVKLGAVPYAIEADHAVSADQAQTAITATTVPALDSPAKVLAQVNSALANGGALSAAAAGYQVVSTDTALEAVPAGSEFPQQTFTATCPAGKKPLGGGCATHNAEWFLWVSEPSPTGWVCIASNLGNALPNRGGTGAATATATAICAQAP